MQAICCAAISHEHWDAAPAGKKEFPVRGNLQTDREGIHYLSNWKAAAFIIQLYLKLNYYHCVNGFLLYPIMGKVYIGAHHPELATINTSIIS